VNEASVQPASKRPSTAGPAYSFGVRHKYLGTVFGFSKAPPFRAHIPCRYAKRFPSSIPSTLRHSGVDGPSCQGEEHPGACAPSPLCTPIRTPAPYLCVLTLGGAPLPFPAACGGVTLLQAAPRHSLGRRLAAPNQRSRSPGPAAHSVRLRPSPVAFTLGGRTADPRQPVQVKAAYRAHGHRSGAHRSGAQSTRTQERSTEHTGLGAQSTQEHRTHGNMGT
jgi:hypothetical protein